MAVTTVVLVEFEVAPPDVQSKAEGHMTVIKKNRFKSTRQRVRPPGRPR